MTRAPGWGEDDTREFIEQGDVFVPHRDVQLRVLVDLLPEPDAPFLAVDLGCGPGRLTAAILQRHAQARVLAVDGSEEMLAAARGCTERWRDRVSFSRQRLEAWEPDPDDPPLAVLTSLALHHLEHRDKRELFARVAAGLRPGGTLLVADLVAPESAAGIRLAAAMWEEEVARRSLQLRGDSSSLQEFRRLGWNMYALPEPDPEDRPAPLAAQLGWLRDAGFERVDVFWMWAGHAIFGGHVAAADGP